MAALAITKLDMCQTPQQTAEMNPSHWGRICLTPSNGEDDGGALRRERAERAHIFSIQISESFSKMREMTERYGQHSDHVQWEEVKGAADCEGA